MIVFAINLGPEVAQYRCDLKWKDSGLAARFEFWAGCLVSVDGRWVPENNVQIRPRNNN